MNNLRLLGFAAAMLSGCVGLVYAVEATVMSPEDIFGVAEANSVQMLPYSTAVSEAAAEVAVAKAAWLPDIDFNLEASFIGDGFTTKRNFSDYQRAPIPHLGTGLGVELSQPVYTGGAVSTAVELARLKTTAAQFAADLKTDNIRFRLMGFYLDLYKYTNLRKVVCTNIEQARRVLDQMRARYEQGMALHNDITRYELLLSDFELRLIKIDNMLNILNNNIVVTAGLPDGTVIAPDTTILARAQTVYPESWWQAEAVACSPSLQLARMGVSISRKAEDLARAERLPKVGVRASWSMNGPILVEVPPINRNLSYWYVGLGVSYNISSLYKANKKLKQARTATLRAGQELDVRNQELELDVRRAHIGYLEAEQELRTLEKSVELACVNYNTTATRYDAEMALLTDMLDAANAKLDAEQQLINARINIIYSYYRLLFIVGKI